MKMAELKYRKYDAVTRQRLWSRIKELANQKLTHVEAAAQLQKEGWLMPDGKSPLTQQYVGQAYRRFMEWGEIKGVAMPTKGRVVSNDKLPSTVLGILTDPDLSDSQKIKMICAYAEV